jgi:ADP-ribose pyrophosphatase YjhB (NUDIX family)
MEEATLCFCIKDDSVLLAEKKTSFGAGKLNGQGGKIKPGETPEAAALRELKEKSGLTGKAKDLKPVALLYFYNQNVLRFTCHVYTLKEWEGVPKETAEMKKAEFFKFDKIPYGTKHLLPADQRWLPRVLHGETITAHIYYNADGTKVDDFTFEKTAFKK